MGNFLISKQTKMRNFAVVLALFSLEATAHLTLKDLFSAATREAMVGAANKFLGQDITESPMWDYHVTTRADTRAINEARMAKHAHQIKPLTHQQRKTYEAAHHNMMAQRRRLGLSSSHGTAPMVGQDYAELNSAAGFFLNMLTGLSYGGQGEGACYDAAESWIISWDTGTDVLKKLYIPAFWAEAQIQLQDFISITSAFYVDCDVNKLFNTVTHLVSSEGLTELSGRVSGAYFFEIRECQDCFREPDLCSKKEKGYRYGKCASIALNYTI